MYIFGLLYCYAISVWARIVWVYLQNPLVNGYKIKFSRATLQTCLKSPKILHVVYHDPEQWETGCSAFFSM